MRIWPHLTPVILLASQIPRYANRLITIISSDLPSSDSELGLALASPYRMYGVDTTRAAAFFETVVQMRNSELNPRPSQSRDVHKL